MEIDKENVVQAVVLMDTFNKNFNPVTKNMVCWIVPFANDLL